MPNPWDALADSIVDTVKERVDNAASEFLEENAEAKDFLTERGKALAKAVYEYKLAGSDADKAAAEHEMNIIRQTLENKLSAIALNGADSAKSTFKEILNAVFGVVVKAAPALLAMI